MTDRIVPIVACTEDDFRESDILYRDPSEWQRSEHQDCEHRSFDLLGSCRLCGRFIPEEQRPEPPVAVPTEDVMLPLGEAS